MKKLYDVKEIKKQLVKFFESYDCGTGSIDKYIKEWEDANEDLIKLFGGKVIVSRKVEFKRSESEVKEKYHNFFYSYCSGEEARKFDYLVRKSSYEALIVGAVDADPCTDESKDKLTPAKYKKGMKISKLIPIICEERPNVTTINNRVIGRVEFITINLSKTIQDLKQTGIVCLSVHPLDYLTMSLNKNGWSSCHAPGGGYVGGCGSYMFDKVSAIGYFHSGKVGSYDFGEWNSKAWRQMVHIDIEQKMAMFNRQYPRLENTVSDALRTMVEILLEGGDPEKGELEAKNPWYISSRKSTLISSHQNKGLHYPDLEHGHENMCRVRMDKTTEIKKVTIGRNPVCPTCGSSVSDSDTLSCCDYDGYICSCCDDRIRSGDERTYNGNYYCESCFDDCFQYCPHCDNYEPNDDFVEFRDSQNRLRTWCNNCADGYGITTCAHCGEHFSDEIVSVTVSGDYICDNCSESHGYNLCYNCSELSTDCVQDANGNLYCEACAEGLKEEE